MKVYCLRLKDNIISRNPNKFDFTFQKHILIIPVLYQNYHF